MNCLQQCKSAALSRALGLLGWAFTSAVLAQPAVAPTASVVVRFVDSATGYALQPEVSARPARAGATERRYATSQVAGSGHAAFALERGRHTLTATAPGHWPASGPVEVRENLPYEIRFLLDPVELPQELRRADIVSRQRDGATLFQGFIVDDAVGEPLKGVRVRSSLSGSETVTDARGYYQLYVPVLPGQTDGISPDGLLFEKSGYVTEERQYLELWSRGDWTWNVRLQQGHGRQTVDQRTQSRPTPTDELQSQAPQTSPALPAGSKANEAGVSGASPESKPDAVFPADKQTGGPLSVTSATIRVPRNIRVEKDGIIYYVSMNFYTKHVLPHEWLASWNITSLYAGSVAVRSYAIGRINGRAPTSDYDICGTSSCQVFKPNSSSTRSDNAVDFTDGYVLLNNNGNIASTEYSAENNSLGKDCGDGFTAPSGGCLYDPICAGHDRSGHGRGMCQRGSERWATGANGFPVRDWLWIIHHYYPDLTLIQGMELQVGDAVRSRSSDCNVRACAGGGIGSGVSCPLLTTKSPGQTGVIIGGPSVITNDAKGFTWYQVRWDDAGSTTGWSCENYLERVFSAPPPPTVLAATAVATNRINLSWTYTNTVEAGFAIERAPAAAGPWLPLATVEANVTAYADLNLYAGSTWYYRVLAFNAAGSSGYSVVAGAATPADVLPTLPPLHDVEITPGTLLRFTNSASAPERVQLITDFEPFMSETANGVVLFQTPNSSSSTSGFLDSAPEMDLAAVTDTYPSTGHSSDKVLYVRCNFTNASNPWLRLTTSNTETFPNPVIDLTRKLRFDVYAGQPVKVAVGCRETTTSAGSPMGSDGGTIGSSIEWAGVTNVAGTAPRPTRTVTSNTWTTLTFDFPSEPIRSFSGGNGVLSTASGLGVLEHLAIVPAGGIGVYELYFDNFAVLAPRTFTYSLGAGAPASAGIDPVTGVFSWVPTQGQSQSTNVISIVVTDSSSPPLRATNAFTAIVRDTVANSAPLLAPIGNRTVYAGSSLTFTNTAYDPNPGDALTFSLDSGAPPTATINPATGVFSWTPASADTNSVPGITVRVTDSGSPHLSATSSFSVTVLPPPPPNQAPLLLPINNCTINASSTLTFTNVAFDPDGNALIFSLGSGSPAGATIDPISGVLSWMPPDADSNTTQYVTVRVTDSGIPPLSASATFGVTVLPRLPNQPPTLSPIPSRTVHAGSLIVFTNAATDPNPADVLSFSLDDTAPAGAEIDTITGIFSWTPSEAEANTTNSILVWVTDDGEPGLSASTSFDVIVRSRPLIQSISTSNTILTITWSAIAGVKYRPEYKDTLSAPVWQPLGLDITAVSEEATAGGNSLAGHLQRFYRVRVLDPAP